MSFGEMHSCVKKSLISYTKGVSLVFSRCTPAVNKTSARAELHQHTFVGVHIKLLSVAAANCRPKTRSTCATTPRHYITLRLDMSIFYELDT